MKNPIFIVGLHRTGSTLWHNLVAMCPYIMRLTEIRFLSSRQRDFRYFIKTQLGDLSQDVNIEKMVRLCFSKQGFPGLEGAFWRFENIDVVESPDVRRAICEKIKESDRSLGAIFRSLIDEITSSSGFSRACVKFPVDVGHIPQLLEWYPDCRIVHITRDPRALTMSKTNDPAGTAIRVRRHPHLAWFIRKATVLFEISQYRLTARLHTRFRKIPNYRLFRYEDLLAEPEKTIRELCDFTNLEFAEEMVRPEAGRHEHQPSSVTGKRQKAFDASAAIRWKTVISRMDYLVISLLTRNSMKKLEYDPKTHPVFSQSKAQALRKCTSVSA